MNVLLVEGQVTANLDFDRLAYRELIVGLATSLSCALSRFDRFQSSLLPPTVDRLRQLARWLRAYADETSVALTPDELPALPFEMARVQLFPAADAGYLAAGQREAAIEQTLPVARHLPRAWWMATNAEGISEFLATL
jgi:hypothetical protein